MTDQTGIEWPTCDKGGCIGVRLAATPKCLAHAGDEQRNATLKQLGETGEIDARGVPITQALLEQILAAAPLDAEYHPTFKAARFDRATFQSDAGFGAAIFQGTAGFGGASFQGTAGFEGASFQGIPWFYGTSFQRDARFYGATFKDHVGFGGASFQRDAWFEGASFQGDAWFKGASFQSTAGFGGVTFQRAEFEGATFKGDAGFAGATFQGTAWFAGATFQGDAGFYEASFQGTAWFAGATFQGDAGFGRASFKGDARFYGAIFRRDAGFGEARFEQARRLGPLLVYGLLGLDAAHFAQPIQIEASTRGLSCQRTRFPAGVQFRLRGPQIVLDDADLPSPSILVGIDELSDPQLVQAIKQLAPQAAAELSARPRLLSLQGANVAGLGLANVDLRECRFAGAHNLDRLRLETKIAFSEAAVRLPWDWRRVIAEEHAWRAARSERWAPPRWWPAWLNRPLRGIRRIGRSKRWERPESPPAWLHGPFGTQWPGVLPAGQIAGLYRALRKGREDAKDEPGAADFYYGEMEMRRHARPIDTSTKKPTGEVSGGQVERAILTVYWLISGYGLRAWRALAWLAALTAGFAVAFHLAGFTRPPQPYTYWTSLLYAFRATLSLTDSEVQLTAWGKLLQALLRLTGPVLLALALLAIPRVPQLVST
jgi:uncharacterized protein YjbI with pentapeptide repeats